MYKKVNPDHHFARRELNTLDFWQQNKVFEKCCEQHAGSEPYTFYDGPPTANGKPHIGHILTRCIKDLFPRYKSMQGYDVLRKAGWDTHGLPVELEVEKQLGLDGKEQIEAYGVEDFIQACKQSVWKYKAEWERMSARVGFWADMEDPYITYENDYIESVWWSLKQIADQGLLYKGHKVVPYCPRCGTALSSHEVAQGYKDVEENSLFVKFALEGKPGEYFIAWTTTPWTLPSNVALCVNPRETYARVQYGDEVYILARALCDSVLGEGNYTVINTCAGEKLVGTPYVKLFDLAESDKKGWYIVSADFVTLADGSGIVHIAPAFGEDDARVGQEYDLPFVQLIDARGNFTEGTPWQGIFAKEADPAITQDLDQRGLIVKTMAYTHNYPFCWRCDTPLLYYARSTWFVRMTAVKDKLLDFNNRINWIPENIKEGRMGNFLNNVIDWGLSRERYWGTPLPVWECACGAHEVVGSVQQLRDMGGDVPDDLELHKPYIDRIHLDCPQCGGKMRRVTEVIDCWYDSGSMPFAQWHYPFENKEEFERRYPAAFISEAVDQTRGWFYTLLAISTCVFEQPSFKNCLVLGHVQDREGKKMSKHLGNVVDPWDVLDHQGADAVRWYFYTSSAPWLPNRFYADAVNESQRKFMGTLYNTYAFYILYAEIDRFDPTQYRLEDCALSVMDRYILSRLHSLIKNVCTHLDAYRITESARAIEDFVDELSNWYVRRSRERFWGSGYNPDKISAFMTLFTALQTLTRLIAPFTPFLAEEIYQNLVCSVDKNAPQSVHLCSYPVFDQGRIDTALENSMQDVLKVVVLGRSARNTAAIKNRQPLGALYVQGIQALEQNYYAIICDELNVKELHRIADISEYMRIQLKPQLKTLGPRYGKLLPKLSAHLQQLDGAAVLSAIEAEGKYSATVDDTLVELTKDDLLVETHHREGFCVEQHQGVAVALSTTLTEVLLQEGYMREMVSKIQTMRKEAQFDVTDHIRVTVQAGKTLQGVLAAYRQQIAQDVLADYLEVEEPIGYIKEWDINGKTAAFGVQRV